MNFSALYSHDFRIYLIGNFIFLHGLWAQRIVLGWLAWDLTESPSFVGFAAFISFIPTIVSGPFFGVITDRSNLKIASFSSYLLMIIVTLSLYLVMQLNYLTPSILAFFCLLIGIIASAHHPIRMSLGPRLVKHNHVPSVIALSAVNFNTSRLVGPAIGGILIQLIGPNNTLLLTALCSLPILFVITLLKPRQNKTNLSEVSKSVISSLIEGANLVSTNQIIKLSIILSGLTSFIGRGVLETLPLIAEGVFSRGPNGLGIITSAAGGGALLASITKVISKKQKDGMISLDGWLSCFSIPIVVLVIGLSENFIFSVILICVLGFFTTILGISMQSVIQTSLTDEFRGRVMSIWVMLTMGGAAFGAIIIGFVSELAGISETHVYSGLILAIFICFVYLYNHFSVRRLFNK